VYTCIYIYAFLKVCILRVCIALTVVYNAGMSCNGNKDVREKTFKITHIHIHVCIYVCVCMYMYMIQGMLKGTLNSSTTEMLPECYERAVLTKVFGGRGGEGRRLLRWRRSAKRELGSSRTEMAPECSYRAILTKVFGRRGRGKGRGRSSEGGGGKRGRGGGFLPESIPATPDSDLFPSQYLPESISSRVNIFPSEYLPESISSRVRTFPELISSQPASEMF
jgi:hypothetical protein